MHYALPLGQVGTNGYITFGSSVYTEYRNGVFPGTSGTQYIVAAFWDDIDPAKGGWITYEVFQSGDFLDSVNAYIKRKRPTSFQGTWMLVASYEKVNPFSGTGEVGNNIVIWLILTEYNTILYRTPFKSS